MLVQNSKYPEFVADQLLTSDNLNDLFGYLDEQGRITRTNLIGIGIVCGLEVKTSVDGTSITISKGTGVTSEGYMVTIPETVYTDYVDYDPLKEEYYDKFVNTASKTKKFENTWELKQAATEASTKLNYNFLNGNGNNADKKVVLLFVEMLNIGNKNCNPNSCDDKGITIEITIRPLLIRKADVDSYSLTNGANQSAVNQNYIALEEKRIPRFDVVNTRAATTADVFHAYQKILNTAFLNQTEQLLTGAWNVFYPVIASEYNNVNPFQGLASAFAFLHNGSMDSNKILFMQYYYDHFSDLLAAYDEFRITGMEILSTCCPDSGLFPRHLLLDLAIKNTAINYSQYRHYFIYSPLFQRKDLSAKLKMLFRRMALIRTNFSVPSINGANSNPDAYQRITPSRLDASPLSQKAIPYYYMVNNGANPLFKNWNADKSYVNAGDKNLSYHASQYSSKDFVTNPLNFDLEQYNFLRIEGIIGKQYTHVLRNLKRLIHNYRLPTDVIAICTDNNDYSASRASHNSKSLTRLASMTREGIGDIRCYFKDLEAIYDSVKNETLCTLCKELRYYYEIPIGLTTFNTRVKAGTNAAATTEEAVVSEVTLFERCTKVPYLVKPNTFGVIIEKIYKQVGNHGEVTLTEILEALGIDLETDSDGDGQPDRQIDANIFTALILMMPILEIPIYIIRLSNYFTEDLHHFDVQGYCRMQELISKKIKGYRSGASLVTSSQRAEIKSELTYANTAAPKEALSLLKDTDSTENSTSGTNTSNTTGTTRINTNADALSTGSTGSGLRINSLSSTQGGLGLILLYMLILEDLYDHLDVLVYNCKCRVLMGLKEEYLRRVAELSELRQLQNFSQRHPGLQHKAGVTMGGTFIILYHSPTQTKRAVQIKEAEEVIIIKDATHKIIDTKVDNQKIDKTVLKIIEILRSKKISMIEFTTLVQKTGLSEKEVIAIIKKVDASVLNNVKGLEEQETKVSATSEDIIDDISDNLPEGIVIADFYLPYLCYSNCPPIVYQVPEIKDVPVDVNFSLQPNPKTNSNVYSVSDETEYVFTLSPAGGNVNNGTETNGVFAKNGGFIFIPGKVADILGTKEKVDLNFTYTVDGVTSNTVIVTVYTMPTAKIILSPDKMPQPAGTIKITSESSFADKYNWYINGKEESTDEHIGERDFKEPGTYTISLSVTQSVTGVSHKADEAIIEIVSEPSVSITSVPVITSPVSVGSTIKFNAEVQNATAYSWLKNNAEISKEKELAAQAFETPGTFTYKLVVTQSTTGKSATSNAITIQVEGLPTAAIVTQPSTIPKMVPTGTTIVFNGSFTNAQEFKWIFEDAAGGVLDSKATQNFGAILFSKPGTYRISFTAIQISSGKTANAAPVIIEVGTQQQEMFANISLNPPTIGTTHPAGTSLNFESKTQNINAYKWLQNNIAIKGATTPTLNNHVFPDPGSYDIMLVGANAATGQTVNSNTVKITIEKSLQTENTTVLTAKNTCADLSGIITGFKNLSLIDKKNFPEFDNVILGKVGINDYFSQLSEISSSPIDVQIEFFTENIFLGGTTDENLARWMILLADIITDDAQKTLHLLASALYRILLNFAMYIACIQKDDITKAQVPMAQVLQSTVKQLQAILEILSKRIIKVKEQVNAIPADIKTEQERMATSGTDKTKLNYKSILDAILNLF